MNVYISGPMTGYPEHNFPAFEDAQTRLMEELGGGPAVMIYSPHNFDAKPSGEVDHDDLAKKPWEDFLRRDINFLTSMKFDRIYVLPGWEKSRGARLEVTIATQLGAELYDIETMKPWDPGSETILEEAQRLTSTDRQKQYGHPYDDFNRTAAIWNALFGKKLKEPFDGSDVPLAMVAVKLSREVHAPKRDNLVDGCGYLRTRGLWFEEYERRAKAGLLDWVKLAV